MLLGVGFGDTWILVNALNAIGKREFHLARVGRAGDRRGTHRIGGTGQWDVSLTGKQTRSGIQPQPARPGYVDLRPGVQIGKIMVGSDRPLQRFHVRSELDQIARNKACSQSQVAQNLDQQPTGIAAGTQGSLQGVFAGLDSRLHPNGILHILFQPLV